MSDATLTFRIPANLWMSANKPLHWADAAKRKRQLRTLGKAVAQAAHLGALGPVAVEAHIGYPKGVGRADPQNEAVSKHLLDGIVDSGVLVDDSSEHVVSIQTLRDISTGMRGVHSVRLVLSEVA